MADELLTAKAIAMELAEAHGLGEAGTNFRTVRHLTNMKLIPTKGVVNIGTGRRRLYTRSGFIWAAILIRLSPLKCPISVLAAVVRALRRSSEGADLLQHCRSFDDPVLVIQIPDKGAINAWVSNAAEIDSARDAAVLHLRRFIAADSRR